MPPLVMNLIFNKVCQAPAPFFIKPVVHGIDAMLSPDLAMAAAT